MKTAQMHGATHGEERGTGSRTRAKAAPSSPDAALAHEEISETQVLLMELQLQNRELRAARDQAELALKRFTDLYDSAPVGYLTLRRDGTIRDVNRAGARLLGSPRSKLRKALFAAFVDGDDQAQLARFTERVFEQDARRQCELTLHPAADRPPLVAHIEAMRDDSTTECRLTLTDITERKQAENERHRAEEELRTAKAEAERANAAKSKFLAAASHDLRQPLSALSLYIGTLEDSLPADQQELAHNMKQCMAGLNELLADLLDLSKLNAGVVVPKACDFSLDSVLAKVVSSLEPKARRKRLSLRCRYGGQFGRTDPVLFRRIVTNLVSNAIRYTERGGVLIGCRRKHGKTWVEVWDTGIGIPADQIPEIFEEFRQLGNSARNREQGTGIGLAIVAKEAALLGLRIRVRSIVGKGSLFAIELPPGAPMDPALKSVASPRSLRIAIVEDNAEVAKALSFALSALGHVPVISSSCDETMKLLAGSRPDIVVSDYRLGGSQNGCDVVAAMRAAFGAALPALLITGDTDRALMRLMAKSGIAVQHKPLNMESLTAMLAELTDRRGASG